MVRDGASRLLTMMRAVSTHAIQGTASRLADVTAFDMVRRARRGGRVQSGAGAPMSQMDVTEQRRMWRTFARITFTAVILIAILMVLLALIFL